MLLNEISKLNLLQEVNDINYIEEYCYSMNELPELLFNKNVTILLYYDDKEYDGNAHYLYKYNNMYFTINLKYGNYSECDDWIGKTYEYRKSIINNIIMNDVYLTPDLWKVQVQPNCLQTNWLQTLEEFMNKNNCLDKFLELLNKK
jgi:hypothetical protein